MSADSHNARRKSKGDPRPQLDSLNLAEIRARYVGSRLPAETAADMEALWLEVDRLRFTLAGQTGRAEQLKDELADVQSRYYQLKMTATKGGPV